MTGPLPRDDTLYDPAFVAGLFDRCASNYRWWSAISSFGFTYIWRRQCVRLLPRPAPGTVIVDLMAGTGELWPHLLRHAPDLATITALDISHGMHLHAVDRLHGARATRITHIEADALTTDLPEHHADLLVASFGLKTFSPEQQAILARQIARLLKPGGHFALIEASDPHGWALRPLYRAYIDHALPLIERLFLRGAQDFTMLGPYTRNFRDCTHMAAALRAEGLTVTFHRHFFGCATSVSGHKPA